MRRRTSVYLLLTVAMLLLASIFIIMNGNHSASGESETALVEVRLPVESGSPEQTLKITHFNYHQTSNSLSDIEVRINNVTQSAQDGLVWYILAPAGSTEPWLDAVYSAPEHPLSLQPDASEVIRFEPPASIAEGDYDLSVWVHGMREGSRFHSDGAGADRAIYIGAPFTLNVTEVDRTEQIDGSLALEVTVEASNHSGEAITADLLFTVIAAREAGSLSGLPEFVSSSYSTELADGERTVSTLRGALRLEPGVYSVIGWLRRRDTNAVIERVVSTSVINIE